jgi:hypothetical protein
MMGTNEEYLKEHGLPKELDICENHIGEWLAQGCFRNLLEIVPQYGIYSEELAKKLVECYNNRKRLIQILYQFRDGRTQFVAQSEISNNEELLRFTQKTAKNHPLPKGAQWLCCNEQSEHFWKSYKPLKATE